MEDILVYLPVVTRGLSLSWPAGVLKILRELEGGRVLNGLQFVKALSELRDALSFPSIHFADDPFAGYTFFFDKVMSTDESRVWFKDVVPQLAKLLLRLPKLLEAHYENANIDIDGKGEMVTTCLRILDSQQPGIVFLSQELIAALLACSLFCLFPDNDRHLKHLPAINFDQLFVHLKYYCWPYVEEKIWCIIHYFQRISSHVPVHVVSFERRVLYKNESLQVSYPDAEFWSASTMPLCRFDVDSSGVIGAQSIEAVEVYFGGKTLGGDALGKGTSPDEIRFVLSPELIAGMLFLPAMADNEAIEIVGGERFLTYEGFVSSFRFSSVYEDERGIDTFRRRKTMIVAVNASETTKYNRDFFICEINRAFCGFRQMAILQDNIHSYEQGNIIGVATGDCNGDPFEKDHEIRAIIRWLAASQARRPFIGYNTFGLEAFQNLSEDICWILSHGWTVGELWNMLIDYSADRSEGKFSVSFFEWLRVKR